MLFLNEKILDSFYSLHFLQEKWKPNYVKSWDGSLRSYKNHRLHSYGDKPAKIFKNCGRECKEWYSHGEPHRDNDLPAIIYSDGYTAWYKDGERHRDGDKPAIIRANGAQEWWRDGRRHRDNGPALVDTDGHSEWWINGEITREIG